MSDPIEEYCKKEILNTSLFRDNSAKFLDPTFDVKAFLCEVLKVTDMPNINPVLKEEKPLFYSQKTDYSGLAEVGDPRVSLGLTLSAGFTNFMPRNIVYTETLKYGGRQVINDIVCDSDGNPIKISTSNSIQDMEQSQKELEISSILNSEEVKNTYPNYNFSQTICLEQPEIKIADLSQSIDQIDAESLPTIEPFSKEHKDLFSYDTSLDLCTKPLDLESLFIPTTPDEYTEFTKNFMLFGKEQHTLYFIAFLKKFFIARGGTITLHESEIPPMFFVKIKQRITSENVDIIVTKKVTPATKLGGTDIITYQYKSNVKYTYFKYWNDQTTNISRYLNVSEKIVNTTTGIKGTSNSMFRTLVESVPDYKRIMKNPTLQKKFYQYSKKYYVEIPEYYDTNEYTDNPQRKAFVL